LYTYYQVDQAPLSLNQYNVRNVRLQQVLKDRKRVNKMILDFLAAQQELEMQAEERLKQHRDKLEKVNAARDNLKSPIQSLPDLTKLPDITGG
jgi:regulator of Ty1 transposition protein 103